MLVLAEILAALLAATTQAAVPGLCTAPASEHVGEPGGYLAAELDIGDVNGTAYWHLVDKIMCWSQRKFLRTLPMPLAGCYRSNQRFRSMSR